MLKNWAAAVPTCLPLASRCCHAHPSEHFRADSRFRVNAHQKILDTWLLALCTAYGEPGRLTVLERMNMRLHTSGGVGPAVRRRRPDSRTAPGSGRAMPHSHRPRLGQRLAPRHRQIGSY
ncbi:DUF1062 domain-containing protein [Allocatelliglobosispora scoriae]|uniref:DUF1062 domain-containing protein n=1 Tax=Allocatelliglobosispora scoriae TaxID=643052 RepID=UPI001618FA30